MSDASLLFSNVIPVSYGSPDVYRCFLVHGTQMLRLQVVRSTERYALVLERMDCPNGRSFINRNPSEIRLAGLEPDASLFDVCLAVLHYANRPDSDARRVFRNVCTATGLVFTAEQHQGFIAGEMRKHSIVSAVESEWLNGWRNKTTISDPCSFDTDIGRLTISGNVPGMSYMTYRLSQPRSLSTTRTFNIISPNLKGSTTDRCRELASSVDIRFLTARLEDIFQTFSYYPATNECRVRGFSDWVQFALPSKDHRLARIVQMRCGSSKFGPVVNFIWALRTLLKIHTDFCTEEPTWFSISSLCRQATRHRSEL